MSRLPTEAEEIEASTKRVEIALFQGFAPGPHDLLRHIRSLPVIARSKALENAREWSSLMPVCGGLADWERSKWTYLTTFLDGYMLAMTHGNKLFAEVKP